MGSRSAAAGIGLVILVYAADPAGATEPVGAKAAPAPFVVLDTSGFWRMYHVLKPPVAQLDDGLKLALTGIKWLDWETLSARLRCGESCASSPAARGRIAGGQAA